MRQGHTARPRNGARLKFLATLMAMSLALSSCSGSRENLIQGQLPTCDERVTVETVVDRRTLRLSDGTIAELTAPQLFLRVPSPEQPDYFALSTELLEFLRTRLEGHTISVDRTRNTLAICGQDRVELGTALVSKGLLFIEQATDPLESTSRDTWNKLEATARANRLGLWKNGLVETRPFERVARLSLVGLTGDRTLDEISSRGIVLGSGKKLTQENLTYLRTLVAEAQTVIMPRSPNFWQLCCSVDGTWFRVYYPREEGRFQEADYIESPDLETLFRRLFDAQ